MNDAEAKTQLKLIIEDLKEREKEAISMGLPISAETMRRTYEGMEISLAASGAAN